VQPPAVVSVCQRRSRASITAMTTSSRCKPSPQHQWRPWPRSCACVLWGDHGFMPESASWCGGECAGAARQQHSADGRTLCRTRAVRACGTARRCVAHQYASRQSDLRSTPTIGTARGAGRQASSACNHDDPGVRRGRSTNEHIPTQDMPVRCRCGRGGTSPDADVAAVSPVLVPISHG
jgi:hypothetical protein